MTRALQAASFAACIVLAAVLLALLLQSLSIGISLLLLVYAPGNLLLVLLWGLIGILSVLASVLTAAAPFTAPSIRPEPE